MKLLLRTVLPIAIVALSLSSCSKQVAETVAPSPSLSSATVAAPSPVADTFDAGLAKASDAAYATKTAENKEDWDLAAARWQSAIDLMQKVPAGSANRPQADKKLVEYQRNLALAQNRKRTTASALAPIPKAPTVSPVEYVKPEVNSASSTVQVVAARPARPAARPKPKTVSMRDFFDKYLTAVVDKGESGSEYWCSQSKEFESSFFAPSDWRLLDTHTAPNGSGGSFTIQLDSSNKGGAPIRANWSIVVIKEKNKTIARNLPGGWCVASIIERS